jgi:hypothetical protein
MQISLAVYCLIKKDWTDYTMDGHGKPNSDCFFSSKSSGGSALQKPHVLFVHSSVQMKKGFVRKPCVEKEINLFLLPRLKIEVAFACCCQKVYTP